MICHVWFSCHLSFDSSFFSVFCFFDHVWSRSTSYDSRQTMQWTHILRLSQMDITLHLPQNSLYYSLQSFSVLFFTEKSHYDKIEVAQKSNRIDIAICNRTIVFIKLCIANIATMKSKHDNGEENLHISMIFESTVHFTLFKFNYRNRPSSLQTTFPDADCKIHQFTLEWISFGSDISLRHNEFHQPSRQSGNRSYFFFNMTKHHIKVDLANSSRVKWSMVCY